MTARGGIAVGILVGIAVAGLIGHWRGANAQLTERPGCSVDHPVEMPRDLSGLSIKVPRVRVVHTTDPSLDGGSMDLQAGDPFLGYEWGRSLFQRNFRERDGVFGEAGKLDGLTLPDGSTRMMDRGHVSSCGACHNVPYRDAGAGMTIPKNGGTGRNTPHLFGGGLVEMVGEHLRRRALELADTNGDGWISREEMAAAPRCVIDTGTGERIDFGSFADADGDGRPDLNGLFYPVYVDAKGERIAGAPNLFGANVAGYTLQAQPFGFGHLYLPFRPPVSTTLRTFSLTPFDIHAGMQAHDPTTYTPTGGALAKVSNAGMQQFITEAGRDRGAMRGPTGISLDDPDRDGYCEELSEGDLDVVEWYLLNHPAPARGAVTAEVRRGETLFRDAGCASCHVPDWHLPAADAVGKHAGDRRLFSLDVAHNPATDRLEGKLVMLGDRRDGAWRPRRGAVPVRGVFSDFKYHDLGPEMAQMQFDGSVVRQWRTTPLWGVGSTAPYGHDGADLTLHAHLLRHGGEAAASRDAYRAMNEVDRRAVVAFLESLVLYSTDQVPCDIDGDGMIAAHHVVAGVDTGEERFNAEWLFRTPGQIEGWVTNLRGEKVLSRALTNLRAAYGLDRKYLIDRDGDGFPDVIDPAPLRPGFRDGVR